MTTKSNKQASTTDKAKRVRGDCDCVRRIDAEDLAVLLAVEKRIARWLDKPRRIR